MIEGSNKYQHGNDIALTHNLSICALPTVHCNSRAVVLKRDGHLAKVYYLDYGNSESLALHSIFCLPPSQLAVQMLSVRCRYGGHCHSPLFMTICWMQP